MTDLLLRYFPNELNDKQIAQFEALPQYYAAWNEKVNLISRKDIEHLPLRHVLHSLAFAKFIRFKPGSKLLDLGTGGGFPGIPLAIFFPEVHFTLIDGRRNKITAVEDIARQAGLRNVTARHQRAEEIRQEKFDFVLSRAVASLSKLWTWSAPLLRKQHINALPNGLITLKGGNLQRELHELPKKCYTEMTPLKNFFTDPWFEEKYIVYTY